jgi:hypothetical protein
MNTITDGKYNWDHEFFGKRILPIFENSDLPQEVVRASDVKRSR